MGACWQHFETRRWRQRSGKRDTPGTMPAGTDARGAPPKTRMEVVGTGLAPKVEILGRGAMAGGWTIGITGGATVGCTTVYELPKSFPMSQETASGSPLAPEDGVARSSCRCLAPSPGRAA